MFKGINRKIITSDINSKKVKKTMKKDMSNEFTLLLMVMK